ncbi:MAG TPA: hypothetical protein VGJ20_45950 [Xanthobacteraceae bacterium]
MATLGDSDTAPPPMICNECGVDVVEIGEVYMLKPAIWSGQLGLGWTDNPCIGCLEKRLDRKVSLTDMCSFPSYSWMKPTSLRLTCRVFGGWITKRAPYRAIGSMRKRRNGISDKLAKAMGEYMAAERSGTR